MLTRGPQAAFRASPGRAEVARAQLAGDAECLATVMAAAANGQGSGERRSIWVSARDPYLMFVATLGGLYSHDVALMEAEGPDPAFDRLAAACPPALVACDVARTDLMRWARSRGISVLLVDLDQARRERQGRAGHLAGGPSDEVLLKFFTSGTTGTPKCIGAGTTQLVSAIEGVAARLSLTPADISLSIAPLTHTLGIITTVLVALASGGSVAFADPMRPKDFCAALAQTRPTWCAASPSSHQLVYKLLSGAGIPWPGLRFLRASAAPMTGEFAAELEHYYSAPVVNAYAMTEAPGEVASQALDGVRPPGTVGQPTLCDVRIRPDGQEVPAGGTGEIWIRGPNVVLPGAAKSGDWLPTGDIGSLDGGGFLRIAGRVDDIINSGGLKIWPPDVEAAARTDPSLAAAVAFPIPHPGMGERIGLAVVPRAGATVDKLALRRHLKAELPRYAWPTAIVVCTEIPRSARGKIARRSLWRQLPGLPAQE